MLVGVVALAAMAAHRLPAQAVPADPAVVYRREVFRYPRSGRPDPFRSLLATGDVGVRIEDLALRGVVLGPDVRSSIAVIADSANKRTYRLRVGQRLGGISVVGIGPREVELLVNEIGPPRRAVLVLARPGQKAAPQ